MIFAYLKAEQKLRNTFSITVVWYGWWLPLYRQSTEFIPVLFCRQLPLYRPLFTFQRHTVQVEWKVWRCMRVHCGHPAVQKCFPSFLSFLQIACWDWLYLAVCVQTNKWEWKMINEWTMKSCLRLDLYWIIPLIVTVTPLRGCLPAANFSRWTNPVSTLCCGEGQNKWWNWLKQLRLWVGVRRFVLGQWGRRACRAFLHSHAES